MTTTTVLKPSTRELRVYPTFGEWSVLVPGRRPLVPCHDKEGPHLCTRRLNHGGRHAAIFWSRGGLVRAVWRQVAA